MSVIESDASQLRLIGGRPCLDFVNTVGGRKENPRGGWSDLDSGLVVSEKLNGYPDLLAWSQHAGILEPAEVRQLAQEAKRRPAGAVAVIRRAITLREALYRIFKSIVEKWDAQASDLSILNDELGLASAHRRLGASKEGFAWEWIDAGSAPDRMLWVVASSAAELLTDGDLTRLSECGADNCGWLFEDTSRNRSRQWCYMEGCGNLAKVRRFRKRQRRATLARTKPRR